MEILDVISIKYKWKVRFNKLTLTIFVLIEEHCVSHVIVVIIKNTTSWMLIDRDWKMSGDPFSFITKQSHQTKNKISN